MATVAESDFATERTRLGGASALVAAAALVAVAGGRVAIAILGALVVLTAWYFLSPTYAFALGNVALVALVPEVTTATLARVAVVEAGLLGVLLASATTFTGPDRPAPLAVSAVLLVLGWVLVGGALAWASARSLLWLPVAGGLLVALAAFAAYGLHRYQLVAVGAVGETRE